MGTIRVDKFVIFTFWYEGKKYIKQKYSDWCDLFDESLLFDESKYLYSYKTSKPKSYSYKRNYYIKSDLISESILKSDVKLNKQKN